LVPRLLSDHAIPHSLWLTATLPFPARLQLRKILPPPLIELGKFDLPARLQLFIRRVGWENRTESLIQWVFQRSGAGIIFVSTREATLRIARLLTATGKRVVAYHGGMSSEERKNIENQVLRKIPEVIVATSAFGMGMDYSYLNFVVLFQAPTSILSLVQTIGRVGRSEEKHGEALVFWDTEDFRLLEWTVQNSTKRRQEIQELYDFVNSNKCRRHTLKTYFDRSSQDSSVIHIPCNSCDFCLKLFH
jgi:ATP-dependent DNA helicase RecQ